MYDPQKKALALLIFVSLLLSMLTLFAHSSEVGEISARAAALYEPETKRFIYTKNSHQRLPMASTTKIMTALVALENIDLDTEIDVDDRAIGIDGSSIYLEKGEKLTAESLIYATMLSSANDAAAALAYEICGSIEDFSFLMNEKAKELGLSDSNFVNPHGLDDKDHYTSAHDLAIITAKALENDFFKEASSTYKKEIKSSEKSRILVNHNKLLRSYDGCIGVKTGYTQKSGRSLVGAAERDGLTLISVTIDAPNDWSDHKRMLDYGYATLHALKLIDDGEFDYTLPVLDGECDTVRLTNDGAVKIIFEGETPSVVREVVLKRFATAPIKAGDILGTINFKSDGKIIENSNIIATEDVSAIKKRSFFDIFK